MFGCIRSRSGAGKGFTLIELLVVIAIIAILAAILFPVFTKARDNAKLSRCLVHLSQIGKAVQEYCDDHDGRYPIGPNYHYDSSGKIIGRDSGWTSQFVGGISRGYGPTGQGLTQPFKGFTEPKDRPLYKYTAKNTEIWKCPSERRQHNADSPAQAQNEYPSRYWGTSYIFNGVYAWDGAWPNSTAAPTPFYVLMGQKNGDLAPKKTSDLRRPSKIWMVGERTLHYYWNMKFKGGSDAPPPLGHMDDRPFSPVVYCDGHTGTILMTADVLADPNNRWGFIERGWHPDPKWKNVGVY